MAKKVAIDSDALITVLKRELKDAEDESSTIVENLGDDEREAFHEFYLGALSGKAILARSLIKLVRSYAKSC